MLDLKQHFKQLTSNMSNKINFLNLTLRWTEGCKFIPKANTRTQRPKTQNNVPIQSLNKTKKERTPLLLIEHYHKL